jgi:DNA (cytosine-5)-methyltransferase 1
MCDRIREKDEITKPVFVTAPDVPIDAVKTLERYYEWKDYMHDLPIGYVLQNGSEDPQLRPPWSEISAVFIGGDTEWKLGPEARQLAAEAKDLGKWVHMGRVNSYKRLWYADEIGCDSVDGNKFSMFEKEFLKDMLKAIPKRYMPKEIIVPPAEPPVEEGEPCLLDLFCGAGGASMGYHMAGFKAERIFGVDIHRFRHYPFRFRQGGAFELLEEMLEKYPITHIHASPPCHMYSIGSKSYRDKIPYPDLVEECRELLEETGLPYVIENVEYAPLIEERTILLCGTMFPSNVPMTTSGGLRVIRHRLFESNVPLTAPPSPPTTQNPNSELPHKPNYPKYHPFNGHPLVLTTRKNLNHYGELDPYKDFVMVAGGGNAPAEACRDAMGIDWMNRDELCEAIPPVYTRYIGRQLLNPRHKLDFSKVEQD